MSPILEEFRRCKVDKFYILDYGLFQVHANRRVIGLMGALIGTDDGKWVLVDTGMPPKYVDDREKSAAEDRLDAFGVMYGPFRICKKKLWL